MGSKGGTFEFPEFSVEPQVLEEIAAIAALGVEGVTGLCGSSAQRLGKRAAGVSATSEGDRIEIEVHVIAEYGRPLKELAKQLQATIGDAVKSMLSRPVTAVNVYVDGLTFPAGSE